jgi:uncharacterized membrane protein YedE/YeeE
MTDPAKVLAFLDLAGRWDPSLALVMIGAIAVTMPAYLWTRRRRTPVLAREFDLPSATRIDRPLMLGSLLFGAGWGLAGLCPGPTLVLAGSGRGQAVVFVLAMLAGMAVFEWRRRRLG